nr:Rep [Trichosanthes kirilowii CRESS virus]
MTNRPSRRWLITDNTIAADFHTEDWRNRLHANVKYAIWQKEKAATGKVHIQAYIKLTSPQRLTWLKNMLGNVHAEPAKGNDEQCKAYCSKKETQLEGPFEKGECDKQGTRRDLDLVSEELKAGKSVADIADSHTGTFIRFHKGIVACKGALQAQKAKAWRSVKVYVIYGPSGSGKTRQCYSLHPDLHRVFMADKVWFDGYDGQEAILFDDFYGQVAISYMLQLLDGYKLDVPIKGGFVPALWTTVYITSNTHPDEWWSKSDIPTECRMALRRRITDVTELTKAPEEEVPAQPKKKARSFVLEDDDFIAESPLDE